MSNRDQVPRVHLEDERKECLRNLIETGLRAERGGRVARWRWKVTSKLKLLLQMTRDRASVYWRRHAPRSRTRFRQLMQLDLESVLRSSRYTIGEKHFVFGLVSHFPQRALEAAVVQALAVVMMIAGAIALLLMELGMDRGEQVVSVFFFRLDVHQLARVVIPLSSCGLFLSAGAVTLMLPSVFRLLRVGWFMCGRE